MATLLAVPSARTLERSVPAPTRGAWDPRLYQIATLGALLVYGVAWLDLEVRPLTALAIVAGALVTQHLCARLAGRAPDLRSALISALSLCLLLRTGSLGLAALAAVVAIASKFVLRVRGRHVFNPTNLALVALLAGTGQVWVSPGQWGSGVLLAFALAATGGLVVNRAALAACSLAVPLLDRLLPGPRYQWRKPS